MRLGRSGRSQRGLQERGGIVWRAVAQDRIDELSRARLPKAEVLQSAEHVRGNVDRERPKVRAIRRSVGVPERKAGTGIAVDAEMARVHGAVMRPAEHSQPLGVVPTSLAPWIEVVRIEEQVILTARNDTTIVVAAGDLASNRRRNALRGTRPIPHVGARDLDALAVAVDHLSDYLVDGVRDAAGVDAGTTTLVAPRHRDLVPGAPFLARTAERTPRDLVEDRVLVGFPCEIGADSRLEIAEQGHRLGAHLE
jgi:hypothetical protein